MEETDKLGEDDRKLSEIDQILIDAGVVISRRGQIAEL
jgi:hypothetical protein